MVSWLVHSTPERTVRLRTLADDILLLQYFSSPRCINGISKFNARGYPAKSKHRIQWGVEILLVASYYWNWDKLQPDKPLGSYADFTLYDFTWWVWNLQWVMFLGSSAYILWTFSFSMEVVVFQIGIAVFSFFSIVFLFKSFTILSIRCL